MTSSHHRTIKSPHRTIERLLLVLTAFFLAEATLFAIDEVTIKRGDESRGSDPWLFCANGGNQAFTADATFIDTDGNASDTPIVDVTWKIEFDGGDIMIFGQRHQSPYTVTNQEGNIPFSIAPPQGDASFATGTHTLEATVTNAVDSSDTDSDTDTVRMIKVELETVKITDTNDAYYRDVDIGDARICLNAQEEYKRVKYRATVLPTGTQAAVTSTGDATVIFAGIDGSDPHNLENGHEFYVVEDGETGTYEITLTHDDLSICTATAGNEVFELYLHLGNIDTNGSSPADSQVPDIGSWMNCSDDGSKNEFTYQRKTEVKTDPLGNHDNSFDVQIPLKMVVSHRLKVGFIGNTSKPNEFFTSTIWSSDEWELVETCIAALGGPYYTVGKSFLSYVINEASGGKNFTAAACGSMYWNVAGTPFGAAENQNETKREPDLPDALPNYDENGDPWPWGGPSYPDVGVDYGIDGACSWIPYPNDTPDYDDNPIEKTYGNGQEIEATTGYVVTCESSGHFAKRWVGFLPGSYWWAGIDFGVVEARVKDWQISALEFNIVSP